MWLASMSRRGPLRGRPIATGFWDRRTRDEGAALLRRVLGDVGNPARERLFRMNLTLCLHRALTDAEVEALPASFHAAPPVDLAGGPIEVLYESEPGELTTQPCAAPIREPLYPGDVHLWMPLDCGTCASCLARAELSKARLAAVAIAEDGVPA